MPDLFSEGLQGIGMDVFFNEVPLNLPFLILWLQDCPAPASAIAGQSSAKPAFFLPSEPDPGLPSFIILCRKKSRKPIHDSFSTAV
jgi:hypothetical protein